MSLTIEQLSKKTNLSVSTIRVYTSQRNLGKKVGNKRIFSEADVAKLLKGSKKAPSKKTTKKIVNTKGIVQTTKRKADVSTPSAASVKSRKPSFWARLFSGKQTVKVNLIDAKMTK
jgi:hypothetical protein